MAKPSGFLGLTSNVNRTPQPSFYNESNGVNRISNWFLLGRVSVMRGLSVVFACITTLAAAVSGQIIPKVLHPPAGEESAWATAFTGAVSDDSGIWIELDASTANQILDGDIDLLDQYLDPFNGVQSEVLLRDHPTVHNINVVNGLDNVSSTSASASAPAAVLTSRAVSVETNPHGCQLLPYGTKGISGGVMTMHKRTDSGSSSYGIIGWKPYTRCVTAPLVITNQNLFYRTTIGGLWYPEAEGAVGTVRNTKTYQQKNITWYCKNAKREEWMGRTISTVTAKNGQIYLAQQTTQKLTTSCGIS